LSAVGIDYRIPLLLLSVCDDNISNCIVVWSPSVFRFPGKGHLRPECRYPTFGGGANNISPVNGVLEKSNCQDIESSFWVNRSFDAAGRLGFCKYHTYGTTYLSKTHRNFIHFLITY